ncbi:hemagglutinin repeat-containing protein [Rodentibacter sp. Ppn85]|uniref:hemagglutinin repeat-containing protein n=1 Tax=Rodentibacter sp. Ppn85 TaxID=1908525 RepID=UPI00098739F6|nr:hemagglutinin repeat-containing protein [Rodentibacter sp. Ppn85]OOF66790.1 hypothetical protein BKL51_00955 [Rodentibacter sp. Ppn85]
MKKPPKKFKLSASGKLAATLGVFFVASQANADIQPVKQTPTEVIKQGKIEIVNIVSPSSSGLSHNKYNKFNVNKEGAVLNNALQAGKSQLAGQLEKNPNLKNTAANVILNEVVTRNPSLLLGKQEVFGMAADYVLANQGGITCDNCGFINTPRASLVAGRPVVNEGKLTGYETDKLSSKVMVKGELTDAQILDLIAPRVEVNGDIKGNKDVNIVIGQNHLQIDNDGNLSVKNVRNGVMDGKILGSIQANRIRVHAPNSQSRVNIETTDLEAKEVSIVAGNAAFKGKFERKNERMVETEKLNNNVRLDHITVKRDKNYTGNSINADHIEMDIANKLDLTATKIQGKTAKINAGNINLGKQVAEHFNQKEDRQSKGLWYRTEKDTLDTKVVHNAVVHTDKLEMVANSGKIAGVSADLQAKEMKLSAAKGIDLKGSLSERYTSVGTGWANETSRLKTGGVWENLRVKQYEPTQLIADNLLIESHGYIKLAGVVSHVKEKTLINTDKSVSLSPEISERIQDSIDKEVYWGGLAGSRKDNKGQRITLQNGADFVSGDTLLINAKEGVNIKGSRVIAKNGAYVNAGKGNLVIDSAVNKETNYVSKRTGTILNIATHRYNENYKNYTTQGSEAHSYAELHLISDRDLKIMGGNVSSLGVLALKAGQNINIDAAQQKQINDAKTHKLSAFTNIDKLSLKQKELQTTVGLDFFGQRKTDTQITHTAANLSGSEVEINAGKNLNVRGSHITANNGDLNINADKINTTAVINSDTHKESETDTKLTLTTGVSANSVNLGLGINTTHHSKTDTDKKAQSSQLSASNNLNLNAKEIIHQGTQLNAQNVNEKADNISHTATADAKIHKEVDLNAGLNIGIGLNKDKGFSGNLNIGGEGGSKTQTQSTAKGTEINANNINVTATENLKDRGTKYTANSEVNLTAKNQHIESAQNVDSTVSHQGAASISIGATSKDFTSATLNVSVAGKYQNQKDSIETPNQTAIHTNNVNMKAENTLHSEANIQANNVNMEAGKLALNQSTSKEQHSGGGFDAKVEVGAIAVPEAGTALPSVNVALNVNGKNDTTYHGHSNTITADNVNLNGKELTVVQGTNINADNLTINGKEVLVKGTETNGKKVGVDLGGKVGVGASIESLELGAHLNVEHGKKKAHSTVDINANNLNINSETNVSVVSANINADKLNINAQNGSAVISGGDNFDKQTNVGGGFELNGPMKEGKWEPAGGKANFNLDVSKTESVTPSNVNGKKTTINADKNLGIHSSHLTANELNGHIGGNLTTSESQNSAQTTKVDIAVSGSGKPAMYEEGKVLDGILKDLENGTILGLKLDAKVDVHNKDQVTNNGTTLNIGSNNLNVEGKESNLKAGKGHSSEFNLHGEISTDMEKNLEQIKSAKENGKKPFLDISYVEGVPSK